MNIGSQELSSEDQLRLQVLMQANQVQAIRIDEGVMTLYALTDKGEARVQLHANCPACQYLQRVKEFLAGYVLDSPGGFPVFLKRWARMGQTADKNIDALLLLGEPEAVIAVAHAPGLSDEQARRAWWCQPTMDMARCMLEKDTVIHGEMGKVLASFLVEHLPFEQDPDARMQTIRLVLHGKLTDEATTTKLWRQGKTLPYYYIGFLEFMPENLPQDQPERADFAEAEALLSPLIASGNDLAERLLSLLNANGQTWLKAISEALAQPSTSLAVYAILDAVSRYFYATGYPLRAEKLWDIFPQAESMVKNTSGQPRVLTELLSVAPQFTRSIQAMLALSALTGKLGDPWLFRNSQVGGLIRRKIEPMVKPTQIELDILKSAGC